MQVIKLIISDPCWLLKLASNKIDTNTLLFNLNRIKFLSCLGEKMMITR